MFIEIMSLLPFLRPVKDGTKPATASPINAKPLELLGLMLAS